MKVIFMGTPDFAVSILNGIIDAGHEVVCVVTQPDRNRGKGKGMSFSPVKEVAVSHGISVLQPELVRDNPGFLDELKKLNADVSIVAAYGQILPQEVLDAAKFGCLNVHASLLPSYRGAAPIEWSIIDGCDKTGVTIMQMDAGLDTGDMLSKSVVNIEKDDTAESLETKLAAEGADLLIKTLKDLENGNLHPVKQGETDTRYSSMLNKQMGNIDWKLDAVYIERLSRGLYPWPGTYTYFGGKMLKIWKVQVVDVPDELVNKAPGEFFADKKGMYIKTGKGALSVLEVQSEGKKRMPIGDYLRGISVNSGKMTMEGR